ncbi:AraC family transcriptional regulator [Brevibacillus centrosporus]|uniref:AraC family transcriptional regulator n=1 Tax=Brevibacillus centrosporus TaxID=54910 RepID=UPI003987A459
MEQKWQQPDALGRLHVKAIFYQFVHAHLLQKQLQGAQPETEKPTLVEQVMAYLDKHHAEQITLDSLAKQFHYSVRYLTRIFKMQTGYSPIDYLIKVRIQKAAERLQGTDATLQEIAASVGYADPFYFTRLFKKHTGMTSNQYQKRASTQRKGPYRPYDKTELSIAAQEIQRYIGENDSQQVFGGIRQVDRKTTQSIAFALIVALSLLVSACAGTPNTAAPNGNVQAETPVSTERTVTDALGHEMKVPSQPQRVIASYLEDHLIALGVKPVAQWSVKGNVVQQYLQKDLAGVPLIPHDLPPEVVMSYNPDLLFVDSAEMVAGDRYSQYAKITPTIAVGTEKNNDWRQELLTVGDVLNKKEEAKKVLADYEAKAKDAREQLKKAIGTHSAAALWVTGKAVFVVDEHLSSGDLLYKDLGLTIPEVVKEASKQNDANWKPLSTEKLAELNADHLFVVQGKGVNMDEMKKDPIWLQMPAVKNGHVYVFDDSSSWLYTGAIANSQMIDDVLKSVVK